MESKKNTPIKVYKTGKISLAVWENEREDRSMIALNLKMTYFDTFENKWKETTSIGVDDLPVISMLMNKAYEDLLLDQLKNEF